MEFSRSYRTLNSISFRCAMTKGSSMGFASRQLSTTVASSCLPWAMSHLHVISRFSNEKEAQTAYRGDSGSHGVVDHRIIKKKNWNASGKRQAMEPPTKERP